MKRSSSVLLTVAMMSGVLGSIGCNKPSDRAAQPEVAPVTNAPAAQVEAAAKTDESRAVVATAAAKLPAPPVLRTENPGAAPSPRHVWQRGFWRWDAPRTEYAWVPGYWEETGVSAPFAPPVARYEDPGLAPSEAYFFVPGYYRWSGVEYVWVFGHWSSRVDVGNYYRAKWVNVNGRWERRFARWDERHMASYERRHHDRGMRERADHDRGARDRAEHDRLMRERGRETRERGAREHSARQERTDRDHHASRPQPATPHAQPAMSGHDRPVGNGGHVASVGHDRPAASAAPVHKVASAPTIKPAAPRPPTVTKASAVRARS